MISHKKISYTCPAFYSTTFLSDQQIKALFFYLLIAAFVFAIVVYKKKQRANKKPLAHTQQTIEYLFRRALSNDTTFNASFESFCGKNPKNWEIKAQIVEIKANEIIVLKTNLTKNLPKETIDKSCALFTPSLLKQTFYCNFGLSSAESFTLYTFKTMCKRYFEKDKTIYLEMLMPKTLEEGQRRAFPRISIADELLYTFSLWTLNSPNQFPHNTSSLGKPLYNYRHEQNPKSGILNLSAHGLAFIVKEELMDEKNIKEFQKAPCLLLLSLVQQFTDDVLNLWLVIETRHETSLDSGIALGCEIKAWAEHPLRGESLLWKTIQDDEEVPQLLAWVIEDLTFGNHEKALKGLTRSISFPH